MALAISIAFQLTGFSKDIVLWFRLRKYKVAIFHIFSYSESRLKWSINSHVLVSALWSSRTCFFLKPHFLLEGSVQGRGTKAPCRQKLLKSPSCSFARWGWTSVVYAWLPWTRIFTPAKKGCLEGSPSPGRTPYPQRAWRREQACSDCNSGIRFCPWQDPTLGGAGGWTGCCPAQPGIMEQVRSEKEKESGRLTRTLYQELSRSVEGRMGSSEVSVCSSECSSYTASFCSRSVLAPWWHQGFDTKASLDCDIVEVGFGFT